ncbi:MAG TPA: HNH endonuclease signature motif containing protein [Polyangiaceae bacterium]|nr:HNH endonuclease signature motif containing protein [Polyangiaceae bacterium]
MKLSPTFEARFWAKVKKGKRGECWLWQGATGRNGYGRMWTASRPAGGVCVDAHRLAWYVAHGSWPTLYVLHRCDNPPCCNPAHLFAGTQRDNRADCVAKGRSNRGERHGQAVLTKDIVREIRASKERTYVIAARLGVTWSCVDDARKRKSWAWLR